MIEPTKIAFMGDWHGNERFAYNAIHKAKKAGADVVVHTGDYGYTFDLKFIQFVERACRETGMMVYFVDGNHDFHTHLFKLDKDEDGFGIMTEKTRYIPRGHRWEWWGRSFMGLGGAVSVDRDRRKLNVSWWPTETITTTEADLAAYDGHVDVMIAHDCPTGVPESVLGIAGNPYGYNWDLINQANEHRKILASVVDEVTPYVYIHGHYHIRYDDSRLNSDYTMTRMVGLDCDGGNYANNVWYLTKEELDKCCGQLCGL